MARRVVRGTGLVLGGLALGVVLGLVGIFVYFRTVADFELAERLLRGIDLPRGAVQLERFEGDSIARVTMRDVVVRSRGGDTLVAAPLVRFRLDLASMEGPGPVELSQVELRQPYVNAVQAPDGTLNLSQAAVVEVAGQPLEGEEEARGVVLRDVRVTGGRVRLVTPYEPDSLAVPAGQRARIQLARVGGATMRVRGVRDLSATLPLVRFGGGRGWSVEVDALRGRLTDPDLRLLALRGRAAARPNGAGSFRIDELRTDRSSLEGEGTLRLAGERLQYEAELRVHNADFRDLQWFVPALPAEGRMQGVFELATRPQDRVEVRARELVVAAQDSRVTGHFAALVGGGEPATFWDTRIALDPLRLETLRALGFGGDLPYEGEVRGTVASSSPQTASAPELALNLAVTFAPADGEVPVSTLFLDGPVVVGGPEGGVRFQGARLSAQPLHLAALRPLAPEQADRLRGTLRGTVVLTGGPSDLRAADGDLTYAIGDATPSRLTGVSLQLALGEVPRFDLQARAEPLALATLAELFPSLPFRTARFVGPIRVWGTSREVRLDLDLAGAPGRFAVQGSVVPGTPLRFNVSGRVSAFSPEAVLTRQLPVEGPVTGTFAANGSAEDFRFDVDLTQQDGRFALQGRVRRPGGTQPQFEVAGDVANFNLGALIGRPQLFGSRMTGRIELAGGGREPYRFVADLSGAPGVLDVRGGYSPGAVPSYSLSGRIAGLNVQALPGGGALPRTSLNGTIQLQGQGTTVETLAGSLRLSAAGSTVGGVPVTTLEAALSVRDGVLTVDTLAVAANDAQLTASGTLGLTRPVATPLRFRAVSRDLARLAPLLPNRDVVAPRLGGSLLLQGSVAGSVRAPVVDATFRGQNLRYENWRAGRLTFDTRLALDQGVEGMRGTLTLSGDRLQLAGRATLDSLRLTLQGTRDRIAVRAAASRDRASDILVAGVMELEGRTPRAVTLDSLSVRAGESAWQLVAPAELRWGGVQGVRVSNLTLRRVGELPGLVQVDGTLPPTGDASLRVAVQNLNLDLVRGLLPNAPEMAGVVSLNAVLQGPVSDPELSMQMQGTRVLYRGVAVDSMQLTARYDERRMVGRATVWRSGAQLATVDGTVPMRLRFENTIPRFELLRTEPVTAQLVADSLPLALIGASNPQLKDVQGTLSARVAVAGSIDRPSVSGWTTLSGGAVTLSNLGIRYERISGRLTLENQLVRVDSLSLWSDGRALINGTIRLADLDRPELFLTASLSSFHAVQSRDLADLTVSGELSLSGRIPEPVLTGRLVLQNGTIYIPRLNNRVEVDLTEIDVGQVGVDTATARALAPGLMGNTQISDLTVVVEEGVWLQSEDARVEISGELVVFRNGPVPRIYGNLQAVRGTYALTIGPLVREFEVVSGSVRFFGTPDFNPELDITAQHEVLVGGRTSSTSPLAVIVHVTGTLEFPRVALTSNTRPPLPESELLNYLVFGRPTFQSALAGGGGVNPAQDLLVRQFLVQELLGGLLVQELGQLGLPCAYLTLRGRPQLTSGFASNPFSAFGSTTVECGVQLLSDLFLTLETGVVPFSGSPLLGASLDWQINNNLTARLAREPVQSSFRSLLFLGPVEPEYQWSADLRGAWEFGRPRNQAPPEPQVGERPPGSAPPAAPPAPTGGEPARTPAPAPTPPDEPRPSPPPRAETGAQKPKTPGAPR